MHAVCKEHGITMNQGDREMNKTKESNFKKIDSPTCLETGQYYKYKPTGAIYVVQGTEFVRCGRDGEPSHAVPWPKEIKKNE